MADSIKNRTFVEGSNLTETHPVTDEQTLGRVSGTPPVNADASATAAVVEDAREVGEDNLKQSVKNIDRAQLTEILIRAALAHPDMLTLSKHLVVMKMNRKRKRESPLTYDHYFIDMKDYLEADLVGCYSKLDEREKRRTVVALAIHIEKSFQEIANSFRYGRHHTMTFETKFSALETMRKMLFALRNHRWNAKADILRDIITNGHMVGWEKFVVEVCKSFNKGELVLLAEAPPTETPPESQLANGPPRTWLELFSVMVYHVNLDVFATYPEAAKELERALFMIGGTPAQAPGGAVGQALGPTQPHQVELHNPSGMSIVHKR